MSEFKKTTRLRLSSLSYVISAILFVLYPAIRPFSDESSLQGAAAFASIEWTISHMLAMVAFTLLPLGLLGLYDSLQKTAVEKITYWAMVACFIGVGFTLPFYGGETFGLHAIGQEALMQQSAALVSLESTVRSGSGFMMFLIGMLLLAVSSILMTLAIWRSNNYAKWSGIPFALGMLLYLPQFFFDQPLRVAHGVLVAIGCLCIAVELLKQHRMVITTHTGNSM